MLVSVSTMPAGEKYLEYAKEIAAFADFMHLDICDGKYNSTTCFLPEFAKEINDNTTLPIECHLMTNDAVLNAKKYIEAGANIVTAQLESFDKVDDVKAFINYVKTHNALVGLSLEPNTKLDAIKPFLNELDIVLVMSVQTGASGQQFNPVATEKVEELNSIKINNSYTFKIEVDGGITDQTVSFVKQAGADIVVSGNYIFKSQNKQDAIVSLK